MPGPEHVEVAHLLLEKAAGDLGHLAKLIDAAPEEIASSRWLTPWAGGWRYDTEGSPVDRGKALAVAESAVDWAGTIVSDAPIDNELG